MKVRVAVHGRFHAFELARGLARADALDALHTTYPRFAVERVIGPGIDIVSEPHLEMWRRICQKLLPSKNFDPSINQRFAKAVAGALRNSHADILVGWSAATMEAIPVAHARGMKVIIERGSAHIGWQSRVLAEAYAAYGLKTAATPDEIIRRELAEYDACDAISVPSSAAMRSFVAEGVPAAKLIVNPLGVDTGRFSAVERPGNKVKPQVLFVGTVGIRKGVPDLLRATATLSTLVDVRLCGRVESAFAEARKTLPSDHVTFAGPLAAQAIGQAYRQADIFCLPSLEEGFGMAVLEAMASGLPVIVSDQVGAADLIEDGVNGFIVPVGDPDAISQRIERLATDAELRRSMGDAAAKTAAGLNGWDDYTARALSAYRSLLT